MTHSEDLFVDGRLDNRHAVVTGAASGIGRALAEQLVTRGAGVVVADVDVKGLAHVATELGVRPIETNVAVADDMERLAELIPDARLICLNAGVISRSPGAIWEAPPDEWERVLQVNLGGVVNGLRAFVPRLVEAGRPAGILITASLAGLATWPGGGPYAASKHAVVAVAEQAALALASSPVAVTVLCPALVRTGMSEIGDDPHGVAAAAIDGMAQHQFIVAPPEWQSAVRQRGVRLASGATPELPHSE